MIVNNIFKEFKNNVFIETGSFMGDGVQKAIDAGFKRIYSIELSEKYAGICENRFRGNPKVKIVRGDSAFALADILKEIDEPATFWLDGHHSCDDTALGAYWAPLMQELEQINNHHIKTHTILIDDMRCWQEVNEVHGFVASDLRQKVKEINPDYDFTYLDGLHTQDVMACTVKNKIGLLVIATGKYDQFIPPLYSSVKKHFFTTDNVTMFVFTDQDIPEEDGIVKIHQEHLGWPEVDFSSDGEGSGEGEESMETSTEEPEEPAENGEESIEECDDTMPAENKKMNEEVSRWKKLAGIIKS